MARTASSPEQQSVRVLKVGERVRHILSELLARIYFESGTIRSYTARHAPPLGDNEGWHKSA